MARPIDPTTPYRVNLHVTKGYRYASSRRLVSSPKTGKSYLRQIHWGTVDENLKFIPGKLFIVTPPEERKKLVFPDGWDLSAAEQFTGLRKPGRPAIVVQDENRLYGHIWLLEKTADAAGLREDLLKVFKGNVELVDIVMTLAIYLICANRTYRRLASWQRSRKTPSPIELTPSMITGITQSITDGNRIELMRLRAARLAKNELCAVDSTSRSAWGNSLAEIRWGKNKDRLPLAQTLEVVVYCLDSHMPVYYRTFAGNTPDSRSLETILKDLDSIGIRNVVLITDRGYESVKNLETYIDRNQRMIMGAKVGQSLIRNTIKDLTFTEHHHPDGMEIDPDKRIYYRQYDLEYQVSGHRGNVKKARKLRLNLYFDPADCISDLTDLDIAIAAQKKGLEELLDSKAPLDDDSTLSDAYSLFKLEYDPTDRILKSFSRNEEEIASRRLTAGFFANITHMVDYKAMEAYGHYHLREEQERYFAMMKGLMGADRQRNWSQEGKDGRLFILFVAQTIASCLGHLWSTKLRQLKFETMLDVLDEMESIRYVQHPGTEPYITPFVGKQVKICEGLGFEIPKGCAPEYVVRKTNKGKRGRPRKQPQVVGS